MLTGVAFCPRAPALVPAVGRGLDAELGPVRDACRVAIRRVAGDAQRIVVVGSADTAGEYGPTSRGTFAGFGVDLEVPLGSDDPGPLDLPPSLTVGAWLVRDALGPDTGAVAYAVPIEDSDLPSLHGPAPTALVVVGDGSAQRSEKAPGYLLAAGVEFDERVGTALRGGDGVDLHFDNEDPALMSDGLVVWDEVSWQIEAHEWDADLLYDDAPFGVGYFVAAWTSRTTHDDDWRRYREVLEENERWRNDPELRRRTRVRIVG